jgi:transcriptional regulator with XRE-family HTH domain
MVLKDRLQQLRKEKDISRNELADKIGVHVNIVGRYERGEAKPSLDIVIKLAQTLGVSIDYLVGIKSDEVDNNVLEQVLTIQRLPEEDQKYIRFTLGALLRDAKSRLAYA